MMAIGTFLAESALMQSPIGAFLKAVPASAWKGLAIAAAIIGLIVLHQHVAHKAIADAKAEQKAADDAQAAVWARAIKDKADTIARNAARLAKEKNDEAHGRIDSVADALLVRGAGRATCTGVAGSPAGTDQRPVGYDEADAALPQLRDNRGTDLVALPFDGTVAFARQNDRCIVDLRAYEQRDGLIAAGTAKLSQGAKP